MRIINFNQLSVSEIMQAADILHQSIPLGWPTQADAKKEIDTYLTPENVLLAAVEDNAVLGWGGLLAPIYAGNVFEIHPVVVREDMRKKGVGRAVVFALEKEAKRKGGLTVYLGSDDDSEKGETSLADADLYDDLPGKLSRFNPGTHPSGFYLKLGYKIIGVMPDVFDHIA